MTINVFGSFVSTVFEIAEQLVGVVNAEPKQSTMTFSVRIGFVSSGYIAGIAISGSRVWFSPSALPSANLQRILSLPTYRTSSVKLRHYDAFHKRTQSKEIMTVID